MSAPSFTARDRELMCIVWQCMKTKPDIDFEKVAELASFKNSKTARACWAPVMKKIMAGTEISVDDGAPPPASSSKKRKNGPTKDDDLEETPSKKKKAAGRKGKGKAKEATPEDEQEGEGEEGIAAAEDAVDDEEALPPQVETEPIEEPGDLY